MMDRKRKKELRSLNARAWAGEADVFAVNKSLDSSLKKNTAFIKRLRTGITATSTATFLSDVASLSLHKYLSEIISACYEGFCKLKTPAEIAVAVEVASALHQRFGPNEFTKSLAWLLGRGLMPPDKSQLRTLSQDVREREEKERLARQRVLLRVVTELWLVGFVRGLNDAERPEDLGAKTGKETAGKSLDGAKAKASQNAGKDDDLEAESFPLEVLKELLGHDREHANLPLAVLFTKIYASEILGAKVPDEGKKNAEANGKAPESAQPVPETDIFGDSDLVSEKMQAKFQNILQMYLEDVKKHVIRNQNALATQGRRNADAYVRSGEIFEDRQSNFERQTKVQEKLVSNAQTLCEILGSQMPDLVDKEASETSLSGSIGLVKTKEYLRGQGEGPGIWEDEDERRFYENLVDLKGKVPPILLEDGKKKKGEEETKKKEGSDSEAAAKQENQSSNGQSAEDQQSISLVNKSVGAQVDALMAKLPDIQNKDAVDQLALDFCFLNSKASRNKLTKAVQEVPKNRSDLFPMYARLVATLGQYLPDVPQGIITYLDEEFRSLQRRRQKDFLGSVRISNVRYLAELTKFGVVPEHVIFHCFKVSLDDFSRMNIEIISNLLENCGRYLLRNPDTAPRMVSFLETLGRKKTAQHLGQQERMMLENAMYYVDPPERPAIQQKERTPTELYVRKLVYLDMNKRSYAKILKSIRKLHWEEPEVVRILERIFSKPGKVKYSNIHILAMLLSALYRYHQDFVIGIIDGLLENITLGLEQNDFEANQKRLAEVKYLGELYNYKMVDSPVVFDTLYHITTFGHEHGDPIPGVYAPLDPPDNFFRILLVCHLLDTCGVCFDRGSARKKLDFFLTFFQYYMFTKDPLPMDVEFTVEATYSLMRPQWKRPTNLVEAAAALREAIAQNYKVDETEKAEPEEEVESSSEDEIEDDAGADDAAVDEADEDNLSGDEQEAGPEEEPSASATTGAGAPLEESEDEEEQIFVTRDEERDPEAEAEFDRAFERMMAESLESRKFERKTLFDVPLPIMKRGSREGPSTNTNATVDPGGEQDTAVRAGPDSGAATGKAQNAQAEPPKTMAFSLMTKRGNKQQTRTIDLPSDSSFALALKTQQQAEREEQQRIKSLVLNYNLRTSTEDASDGEASGTPSLDARGGNGDREKEKERRPSLYSRAAERQDRQQYRGGFRARKLQMSDVDW